MEKNNLIYNGFLLHPFKIKSIGIRDDYLFSGLLLPRKKSFGYSPSLTSLTCLRSFSSAPSYSCSKFKFKSFPIYHYDIVLTGKQAVNFVTLRDKLEKGLGLFAQENVKIRLVFGVVDLIPLETLDAHRKQGEYFGISESFSHLMKAFKQMFSGVSYQEEGLEFTFGFEAVDLLFKMINHVIESQGKDPEMIHIWMSFWLAADDGHDMSRYEIRNLGSPSSCSTKRLKRSNKKETMRSSISTRSYNTKCSRGGHGNITSIDISFHGGVAVNHNFVFKKLAGVLSPEHKYYCHIHIMSRINKFPLCKELEIMCASLAYTHLDIKNMITDRIISSLRFYNYKSERVDVVLSFFPFSQADYVECEKDCSRVKHNNKFRPGDCVGTDIYMRGVDAVDHNILWDFISSYSEQPGILNGFVGVLDEVDARNHFMDPIHYKYITLTLDKKSMPDLAELIANIIKEARTTPEEVWIVLSYWGYDGSGGWWDLASKCLVPHFFEKKKKRRYHSYFQKKGFVTNRSYSSSSRISEQNELYDAFTAPIPFSFSLSSEENEKEEQNENEENEKSEEK